MTDEIVKEKKTLNPKRVPALIDSITPEVLEAVGTDDLIGIRDTQLQLLIDRIHNECQRRAAKLAPRIP